MHRVRDHFDRPIATPRAPGHGLGACLYAPGLRKRIPVVLDDLTAEGARVRIGNEIPLRLAVGGSADLALVHDSGLQVRLSARLMELREQLIARTLSLEFRGASGATALLDPRLAGLFNRRAAFRVQPATQRPVRATIVTSGVDPRLYEAVTVVDLCTGGMGVVVSRRFERAAAHSDRVHCLLSLPGRDAAWTVRARIRHRTALPAQRVRYGLQFEPTEDRVDKQAYEAILAYVVERRAEIEHVSRMPKR